MPEAGNWLVVAAIASWPIVALLLFMTKRPVEATTWTLLGSLLLLPSNVSIKFDMIPAVDKNTVPSICSFLGCAALLSNRKFVPIGLGPTKVLLALYCLGPMLSSLSNGDTLVYGPRVIPGVGLYDGFSASVSQSIVLLPFLIGQRYFQTALGPLSILRSLSLAGVLFTLPLLLEIQMSPQLSNWIYGFSSFGFSNEYRHGGFRPVVFMQNGLSAAFFLLTALLASIVLWRIAIRSTPSIRGGLATYLAFVLVLCKSGGALVYGIVFGVTTKWLTPRVQARIAVVLVSVTLLYPLARISDRVPNEAVLSVASYFSKERADSLGFRFEQEKQLMERSGERLYFGWGRYGRNRVYDENGKDVSVTDGGWIITLSQFGLVGFFGQFGLLAASVFWGAAGVRAAQLQTDRLILAGLTTIVALISFEQIPNASMSSWTWLLSGALMGRAQRLVLARQKISRSRLIDSRLIERKQVGDLARDQPYVT